MIIIAHRLSTVEHCDQIYRLNNSEIVEKGDYATVIGSAATNPMLKRKSREYQ
jgi:ABC-type multidrug transport system fused ATPase/permease subunit